ncbi:MAG TPA: DUF4157 domain-containing protein, partial [Rhizomicrobium sp.]
MSQFAVKTRAPSPQGSSVRTPAAGRSAPGRSNQATLRDGPTVGAPNDRFEREADIVADRVMRMPAGKASAARPRTGTAPPSIRAKSDAGATRAPPAVRDVLQSQGQPLDPATRAYMEPRFGRDFSDVRVHADAKAAEASRSIAAKAWTSGRQIAFGTGQYAPASDAGKGLLAHELAHTVQQSASTAPVIQRAVDEKAALAWYANDPDGKKVEFTPQLAAQLWDACGAKAEYDKAIAENAIGPGFVELVARAQGALSLPVDGRLGPATRKALDNWQTGGPHGLDYNRMLSDGKLDIGVAIGVEFLSEFDDLAAMLEKHKFSRGTSGGNVMYTSAVDMPVPGDNTAATMKFAINVELISENSAHPKDSLESFLATKDIALYSGHARYGTGPDFDSKESPDQNFVIGLNSSLHDKPGSGVTKGYDPHMNELLKGRKNDLEAMSKAGRFDNNLYQVWMFNACSSDQYQDEIRGGLVADKGGAKKTAANLRIFGTTHSIYSDCVPIVEGLISLQSMQ